MENFIFRLGTINKKLLLPLIYIIIYICINIFWNYTEYNEFTFYLESIGFSIGQIITYSLGRAWKYHNATRNSNLKKKKLFQKLLYTIFDRLFLYGKQSFFIIL